MVSSQFHVQWEHGCFDRQLAAAVHGQVSLILIWVANWMNGQILQVSVLYIKYLMNGVRSRLYSVSLLVSAPVQVVNLMDEWKDIQYNVCEEGKDTA